MKGHRDDWWKHGVLYQIYPRSFRDTNGDGVGDLPGVIEKLDYLQWLGIDGIWLNPTMDSPNDDWGYDVSDYTSIHPELGTMADMDRLISEAGARGIRILLDFVPNHTSTEHAWFKDSISSRDSRHRDWYVWADPKPDGSPPNNWLSVFGGSAWEYDDASKQYYLHNFLDSQADLDWWNDEVRDAMDDVLRFWWDRGVAGFRIDVAHAVIKDDELRDNVPATGEDHPMVQGLGQRQIYNMDRPEVHDVIKRWRRVADSYDSERILVGETWVMDLARMMRYYGTGDQLHLAFNFVFVMSSFDAKSLREAVELSEELLPEPAWPVWVGSNHDVLRFTTRWCGDDPERSRLATMMLLTLRGTPFLYYGDEIGLPNVEVPRSELKDPVGVRFWPEDKGRDHGRTPMHWDSGEGAGFTEPDSIPWLRLGDHLRTNVAGQRDDPDSHLNLTRDLIRLRKGTPDLLEGDYVSLEAPGDVWVYRRGDSHVVALNFSDEDVILELSGTVLVSTRRSGEGDRIEKLTLSSYEGALVVT